MREVIVAATHDVISRGEFHLIKFMHRGTTNRGFSRGKLAMWGQSAYNLAANERPDSSTARAALIDIYSRDERGVRPDLLGTALLSERPRVEAVVPESYIKPDSSYYENYISAIEAISFDFRLAQLMEVLPHERIVEISQAAENEMLLPGTLKLINEKRRTYGLRDTRLLKR